MGARAQNKNEMAAGLCRTAVLPSSRNAFGGEMYVQWGDVAYSWNEFSRISLRSYSQSCINPGNNMNAIRKPILVSFLTHFRLLLVIWEGTFVPMAAHNFLTETAQLSSEWHSQTFGCLSCFQVFWGSSFLTYCTMPRSHWEGENWIRKKYNCFFLLAYDTVPPFCVASLPSYSQMMIYIQWII